ncbi:zinc-binding alcohol dehydrogenase family protein [Rhodococcus sp. BP-332]|uniref:zinc-binding alcohol dehydrogenase family protein n=1 Tax=Rhodococcus sp. BP-332 TaxID=2739447 RepID=UPI001C9AFA87|nr:zinc-binding alcohol dehydrogenase family protein [Rhodococcus sp. BP-332]MBY6677506.1 zinc-binding alcohol dehydrogenase family protein [Rhodococcus sp. BP-332]
MSIPATHSAIVSVEPDSPFVQIERETPSPTGFDVLVRVDAVSVNPVDTKVRSSFDPSDGPKVLGFDAVGEVVAVGSDARIFEPGDRVFYAGSIARDGSNAQYQLVDERIVGHAPSSLSAEDAAAVPLTAITAWESLFVRLGLGKDSTGTLLVMGAAGGTGSMIIQLARALTSLTVVAAASRGESRDWATEMGAHHVVDRHSLVDEVGALAPDGVEYVFSPFSEGNVDAYAAVMAVHGQVVAIDDPVGLDLMPLKAKSQTWHWELMFTVPLSLPKSTSQHTILDEVSRLIDDGTLRSTRTTTLSPFDVDTLQDAHRRVESGGTIGKVVVVR